MPLAIASDKTTVTTMSGKSVWPLYLILGNFNSITQRNVELAKPRLIGLLPTNLDLAKVNSQQRSKTNAIIFARSVEFILEPIRNLINNGLIFECADKHKRTFASYLHAITGDMEEQYRYVQVNGPNSSFPCTKCMVPRDRLYDLQQKFTIRNYKSDRAWIRLAVSNPESGLRPSEKGYVGVKLDWCQSWPDFDPVNAITIDTLHTIHIGVTKYVITAFLESLQENQKLHLQELLEKINKWPGIWSFKNRGLKIGKIQDANYYISLIKLLPSVIVRLNLAKDFAKITIPMLRECQKLTLVSMLDEQSDFTLRILQDIINNLDILNKKFFTIAPRYTERSMKTELSVPKWHVMQHIIECIKRKGSLTVYTTKLTEGCHKKLKSAFKNTNNHPSSFVQVSKRFS